MAIYGNQFSKSEQVAIALRNSGPEYFKTCKEFQDTIWEGMKWTTNASERFVRIKAKQFYEAYDGGKYGDLEDFDYRYI